MCKPLEPGDIRWYFYDRTKASATDRMTAGLWLSWTENTKLKKEGNTKMEGARRRMGVCTHEL